MAFSTDPLFGHVDESSAYHVDDYPYGRRVRTVIRYWLETSLKHGDRFVSQTLNPNTGRWNNPKKSTYAEVGCMFLDDQEHVKWYGIGVHSSKASVELFEQVTQGHLSDAQLDKLAEVKAMQNVMEHVKFEIHRGPVTDEHEAEQDLIRRKICGAIAVETARVRSEL